MVVATRDRPEGVARLLDALERQTLPRGRFEVVIVDDGSGDEAIGVLDDPRIDQVLRRPESLGPAGARNAGWRAASAPLIAFTDDDCRPEPGWLEAGLEVHRAAPGMIVQGPTRPEPEDEHLLDRPHARSIRVTRLGPFFETCNIFYPRPLLEVLDGFDEAIPTAGAEDTDLAMRGFEAGAAAVFAPGALVSHAVREFSIRSAVRFTYRWRTMVPLVKRHPRLRAVFPWHGFVWRETHARLLLALAGLALARRRPEFLLWCAPYLSYRHGWRPEGLARSARELPGAVLVDGAEVAVLAAASARHRWLLI